jgi:hypothetical protein
MSYILLTKEIEYEFYSADQRNIEYELSHEQ